MPPPPATALAEQELADRARDGDEQALGELYHRHAGQLHRHAWRMLRDEAAAGDVVQEAFLRAITAMPRTREGLRFRAWMFRIVTNLCLRELTLRGRLGAPVDPEALGDPAEQSSPEERRARGEWASHVEAALEQLPARYRQILLLREVEGLEYEELGQALELSPAMVKVTLHRARSRFRAHIVAEQLVGNRGLGEACPELSRLAEAGQGHRLERHLETCERCRKEQPPIATLLAALPPAPLPPPELLSGVLKGGSGLAAGPATPLAAPSGAGLAATSGVGVAAWAVGLTVAAGLATVVTLAVTGVIGPRRAVDPLTAAGEQPAPTAVTPASALPAAAATSSAPPLAPLADRRDTRRPAQPSSRPHARRLALPAARPASARPARPSQTVDDEEPTEVQGALLRLRAGFLPGTLLVERNGKSFPAQRKQKLFLGDLLSTRGGRTTVLAFPDGQWLVLSGRLRLVDSLEKGSSGPVRVDLLSGSVRAKATTRGHGLSVRFLGRECSASDGEFRLRGVPGGLRVESLTALVRIRGSHAERVLPRASRLVLTARPGFSGPLLPGPERLRPVQHTGPRPPLLTWEPVQGATSYRVMVAAEPNFWIPEETAVVQVPQHRPYTNRPGRHFWQIIPLQGDAEGYPSKVYAYLIAE